MSAHARLKNDFTEDGGRKVPKSHEMAFIILWHFHHEPRHDKSNKISVRPAKTQIILGIRPVWSESSLCAEWVGKGPSFFHVNNEDSDQTGLGGCPGWAVFAGRTLILLVLSCLGSFYTRASVYKTLCLQHMLAPNTNLENICLLL